MFCWNFGNIGGHGPDGSWMHLRGAGEVVEGKPVPREDGEAGGFAVWRDRRAGAQGFVSFLGTASHPPIPNRFDGAWRAARVGNVVGFCSGLKAGGYFTDGLAHYTKNVQDQLAWLKRGPLEEFLDKLTPEAHPLPPEPPDAA